jgi:hypothetical protein
MSGSHWRFCCIDPCRSSVPIMYICAWQAPPLQPLAWTSSSTAAAALNPRPLPPYSSGIKAPRNPASVSADTNSVG